MADEAVLDLYATELPKLGWELQDRWTGGGNVLASGVTFTKPFPHGEADLSVWASVDDDHVTVTGRTWCDGDRPATPG